MNTQITTALSDAELELITGGCFKRSYRDSDSCDDGSDDYGCEGSYESSEYGCESSDNDDYGSCHKRRFRRFRRHHNSW